MLGQRTPMQKGPERTEEERDPIKDNIYGALSLRSYLTLFQRSYWVPATAITQTNCSPQTEGSMATCLRCRRNLSLSPHCLVFLNILFTVSVGAWGLRSWKTLWLTLLR